MSKKGNAPRSKPSAQAVARAQQRHRRDKWLMPAIIGGLVVAVVLVAVIALTVSGGTDQNGGNASNKIEVAEVATVTGTPLPTSRTLAARSGVQVGPKRPCRDGQPWPERSRIMASMRRMRGSVACQTSS